MIIQTLGLHTGFGYPTSQGAATTIFGDFGGCFCCVPSLKVVLVVKRGLKVGVDERFVSFAEESKEFASLVYIHGAFTFTNDDLSSQHGEKLVVAYSLEALT